MKTLELFAGSRSFTKAVAAEESFTSDNVAFDGIDYVVDVLQFDYDKVPFIPDMIWASPPCTAFSVAAIGKNWNHDKTPKTEKAELGMRLVGKTVEIIEHYLKLNPNLKYYVENPRGMLRKLDLVPGIRHTVTYCQYGDTRMKPTDIWTNDETWVPHPPCKNGDKCHVAAPRGSRTGTQGLKGAYVRSQIPAALFDHMKGVKQWQK